MTDVGSEKRMLNLGDPAIKVFMEVMELAISRGADTASFEFPIADGEGVMEVTLSLRRRTE